MFYSIKVSHVIIEETKQKGGPGEKNPQTESKRKTVNSVVYVEDEAIEAVVFKAQKHFNETMTEPEIKSVSETVITQYIENQKKLRIYQVRVHFKMVADNGKEKIAVEYYLVDANSIKDAEETTVATLDASNNEYEINSITTAKIKEVVQ